MARRRTAGSGEGIFVTAQDFKTSYLETQIEVQAARIMPLNHKAPTLRFVAHSSTRFARIGEFAHGPIFGKAH